MTNQIDNNQPELEDVPAECLFNVQQAYTDQVIPLVQLLSEVCEKIGVQYVMGFCFSHDHDSGQCRHGYSVMNNMDYNKVPSTFDLAGLALRSDSEDQEAVHAALSAYTAVRALSEAKANGKLEEFLGELTESIDPMMAAGKFN